MPIPSGINAKVGSNSGSPGLPSELVVMMSHHNANMPAATTKPAMMYQIPDRNSADGVRLFMVASTSAHLDARVCTSGPERQGRTSPKAWAGIPTPTRSPRLSGWLPLGLEEVIKPQSKKITYSKYALHIGL